MRRPPARDLTDAEQAALSPGLMRALREAGAKPRLIGAAHPAARIASLWHGGVPILARGHGIYWPGLPDDLPRRGPALVAVLQHELQHVLDYATGELTAAGYLLNPKHWTYRYRLTSTSRWSDFGAEQRASIAEHFWLLERGRADLAAAALRRAPPALELYRQVLPWAV